MSRYEYLNENDISILNDMIGHKFFAYYGVSKEGLYFNNGIIECAFDHRKYEIMNWVRPYSPDFCRFYCEVSHGYMMGNARKFRSRPIEYTIDDILEDIYIVKDTLFNIDNDEEFLSFDNAIVFKCSKSQVIFQRGVNYNQEIMVYRDTSLMISAKEGLNSYYQGNFSYDYYRSIRSLTGKSNPHLIENVEKTDSSTLIYGNFYKRFSGLIKDCVFFKAFICIRIEHCSSYVPDCCFDIIFCLDFELNIIWTSRSILTDCLNVYSKDICISISKSDDTLLSIRTKRGITFIVDIERQQILRRVTL